MSGSPTIVENGQKIGADCVCVFGVIENIKCKIIELSKMCW